MVGVSRRLTAATTERTKKEKSLVTTQLLIIRQSYVNHTQILTCILPCPTPQDSFFFILHLLPSSSLSIHPSTSNSSFLHRLRHILHHGLRRVLHHVLHHVLRHVQLHAHRLHPCTVISTRRKVARHWRAASRCRRQATIPIGLTRTILASVGSS